MQGWYLEIEEQGESGERVLMGMHHRLQRTLEEHVAAGRPYDWVLLLAGINDLAGAAKRLAHLSGMHRGDGA
jgi:lysophospholipase L1-like esterase